MAKWRMTNPFREAIRGVRVKLTQAVDVSDELLAELLDNDVLTDEQYEQIRVRNDYCV